MSAPIPSIEPETFASGDTVKWTKSLGDYPATTWTLLYSFRGPQAWSVTASASGTDYSVTISAATTANLQPGDYDWVGSVTSGSEKWTACSGKLTITQNLASVTGEYDNRSDKKKLFDAICDLCSGRLVNGIDSYTIAGRSINKIPIEQLFVIRDRLAWEVKAEENKGKSGKQNISFRFTSL